MIDLAIPSFSNNYGTYAMGQRKLIRILNFDHPDPGPKNLPLNLSDKSQVRTIDNGNRLFFLFLKEDNGTRYSVAVW